MLNKGWMILVILLLSCMNINLEDKDKITSEEIQKLISE